MNETKSHVAPGAPPPQKPRLQVMAVTLRGSFTIGGQLGQSVREIKSYDMNTAANKNVKIDVDWEKRVVLVRFDNGNGYVLSGCTPFENVIGMNFGVEASA